MREDGDASPWAALFAPEAWADLLTITARIPDLGQSFGFECRLGSAATRVDFGLSVRRPAPNDGETVAVSASLRSFEPVEWRRLGELRRAWAAPDGDLYAWVPFAFLEFDARQYRDGVPIPSVFLTLDWPADGQPVTGPATPLAAVRAGLALLQGALLAEPTAMALAACFEALPVDGRVVHVGAMLGRDTHALRVSTSLPLTDLAGYLGRIGSHAPVEPIEEFRRALMPTAARVHIEHDVGAGVEPHLGLVVTGDWRDLCDRLVAMGLCTPAKRAAVLAWPGTSMGRLPGDERPLGLRRDVSHVKVAVAPGEPAIAKAYLTVTPAREGNPVHGQPTSEPAQ